MNSFESDRATTIAMHHKCHRGRPYALRFRRLDAGRVPALRVPLDSDVRPRI